MKTRSLAPCVVVAAFACSTLSLRVSAQDAGVPVVCGALTGEGACVGDTAVWCSVPNTAGEGAARDTVSVRCDENGGSCHTVSGVGAWCLVPAGEACASAAVSRVAQFGCGVNALDAALGCDLEEGCRAVSVPCPPDGETRCADGTLVLSCSVFGQPLVVRCDGVCDGNSCLGQGEGALCDDERLFCADGLACLGAPSGRCVDATLPPAVDAGPDRRDPFETRACACVEGRRSLPAHTSMGLLALAAWASRRRRR